MTLEAVGDKQEGSYSCVAENGIGSPAQAEASLSVYPDGGALPEGFPEVTEFVDKDTLVVELGFPMRLACSVRGTPVPEVIWYKNKIPVDLAGDNRIQVLSDDQYCKFWSCLLL